MSSLPEDVRVVASALVHSPSCAERTILRANSFPWIDALIVVQLARSDMYLSISLSLSLVTFPTQSLLLSAFQDAIDTAS